jgi:hypothetical protein
MKLSAPGKPLFLVSLVLLVLALLMTFGVIGFIPVPAIWVAVAAWAALALGCLMTGM